MDLDTITIAPKTYSLQELTLSIQSILLKTYSNRLFWVRCEISRISPHVQSGHCYLELIDKNETGIVAQQRGIIWADKYFSISEKFKAVTNTVLAGGMKVLLQCAVSFHSLHGLSLIVSDIEPSFTLGEMAKMKNDSIQRLKSNGLFNLNRQLNLALLPQRIAIVSVETSRGYQDFMSTINNHPYRYKIYFRLYEAILQGENAVPTLSIAFEKIFNDKEKFDAIAIIRGGAGDAGLSCYDDYSLSALIARSPLPVITGIGHATNETVVEMIAFKNCITPTAAATFLLEKFDTQVLYLDEQTNIIKEMVKDYLVNEKQSLLVQAERFSLIVKNNINRRDFEFRSQIIGLPAYVNGIFTISKNNINELRNILFNVKKHGKHSEVLLELNRKVSEINRSIGEYFVMNKESIENISSKITLLDPINILKRGYSITRMNGKVVSKTSDVKTGNNIETQLSDGIIISTVETIK